MILFFSLLAAGIISFLGFLVYIHDSKSITNKIYFGHSLVIALWSIVNYISVSVDPAQSLIWIRLVLFLAVPHVLLFYLFVRNFPSSSWAITRKHLAWLAGIGVFLMAAVLSPFVFRSVLVTNSGAVPVPGPLIPVFASALIIFSVMTFIMASRKYSHSRGVERNQWKSISIGMIVAYTLLIGLIFIPAAIFQVTFFVAYSSLLVLPIFTGAAYAILRHRFLNVKVIGAELLAFSLVFISIGQTLLARTAAVLVLQLIVTALLLMFSMLLVRSVFKEVEQREQLQVLSKQLESANVQLKELDQAKSEFLSVTSHQLRTPLTAIKGLVSMILEGDYGEIPEKQQEPLREVFQSSERLVHLISDLLDLSRIESGRMEFNFQALNVCEMIDSVVREISTKAKQKGLYLFFDSINRSCPEIKADEEKLRQVFMNLIDNAVKYTEHGGVTIRLIRSGSMLRFSVSDTGIGVDPKDQQRLFEKFFRTEQASQLTREGTGLGIYVVKKIVEAHHGKIWFESAGLGKGTSFFVDLPIPEGAIEPERVKISSLEAF